MQVLGTTINCVTSHSIYELMENCLASGESCTIATLNPEMLLEGRKSPRYRKILSAQSCQTIDGIGLLWILKYKYGRNASAQFKRLTGVDLITELLQRLSQQRGQNNQVFLLAPADGLSSWEETALAIEATFPGVTCSGADLAFRRSQVDDGIFEASQIAEVSAAIDRAGAKYVFCSFGAPFQEYFLDSLKNARIGKSCVYMGVGGSFDYMTGNQKRAPKWMRQIGLEWLFRLIKQPRRIHRIVQAIFIFPYRVLTYK